MTGFSLDNSGQARLALQDILRDFGLAGIDDDALIDRHMPDLLPDAPREAGLLRAAAKAKVGHLLTDRFNARMPPEAAVRDVAAMLADRTAFDANACLWVVVEYAAVLGHAVDLSPKSPPVSGPPVSGPPISGPPVFTPPVAGPPVFVPPVAVPPVTGPPVSGPPVSGPPVSGPPVSGPPISGPPISGPPVSGPPISGPPISGPPISGPPISGPPISGPPVSGPPISVPPQQVAGQMGQQRPPAGFPPPQNPAGFPPQNVPGYPPQQAAGIPRSGMPPSGIPQSGMPPYGSGTPSFGAGYPSQQLPPGQIPNADQTRMDTQGGQPFVPGRAGAVGYNPDYSGQFQVRPPRSKVPLIVGIVVVLAILGTIGIALALTASPSCSASGPGAVSAAATPKCGAGASTKPKISHTPTVGPSTPSGGDSGDPGTGGDGTLASLMPKDVDIDDCDQDDTLISDDEIDYNHCEDATSDESGMTVWAYQYADEAATRHALADFNSKEDFKADSSKGCPAPTDSSATGGWYRASKDSILGTLECYTVKSGSVAYVWTDWDDDTLMIVLSDEDTFSELNSWWKVNNANGADE